MHHEIVVFHGALHAVSGVRRGVNEFPLFHHILPSASDFFFSSTREGRNGSIKFFAAETMLILFFAVSTIVLFINDTATRQKKRVCCSTFPSASDMDEEIATLYFNCVNGG